MRTKLFAFVSIFLVVIVVVLAGSNLFSGTQALVVTVGDSGSYALKQLPTGVDSIVEFAIVAKSDAGVTIEDVELSCSCYSAQFERQMVDVNRRAIVAVRFATPTEPGPFKLFVNVKFDNGESSLVRFSGVAYE